MRSWRRPERLIGLRNARALAIVALGMVAGCSTRPRVEAPMAQQLSAQVRLILGANRPSADYHQERTRLREMGPDLDVILIGLIGDTRARPEARADALILLADRGSPLALPTLASALQSNDERLRSAAVLGLNRLAATDPVAVELIRGATRDRSRTVRLNALQSLDIREVNTIREVLERETDREVRLVGMQLIALAEARGAPLARDVHGSLRTVGGPEEPQIVFRAFTADSVTGVARGDLRIELPAQRDIPLAASATVVDGVVPAFFSPNRGHVVFESDGRIGVVDIETRSVRWVASGIAPRPIPFTNRFVFLEERVLAPTFDPEGRQLVYDVHLAAFDSELLERIGELTARSMAGIHGNESPVRWMVVDEMADGLMLRGENLDTFILPAVVWAPIPHGSAFNSTDVR
jgi:hypothetical protein